MGGQPVFQPKWVAGWFRTSGIKSCWKRSWLGEKCTKLYLTTKCASGTPSMWEFYEIHNRNIEICKISRQVL